MIKLSEFAKKRRQIVVEKDDVMIVLEAISEVNSKSKFGVLMQMEIGSCGWAGEFANKWFMHFDASDRKWKWIIMELRNRNRKIQIDSDNRFHIV